MGEPKNHRFYDFGIFGRVPEPQNQLCLSLETPGYLKSFKKNPTHFEYISFINIKTLEIVFRCLEKAGTDKS